MRLLLLLTLALPACAQFRSMEITFEGVGCATCVESLPSRLARVRGVQSAKVEGSVLKVRLAEQNRVRLEQIRDFIEQDGTKAKRAIVEVRGDVAKDGDTWMLKPAGLPAEYRLDWPAATEGTHTLKGLVTEMHPAESPLTIRRTGPAS